MPRYDAAVAIRRDAMRSLPLCLLLFALPLHAAEPSPAATAEIAALMEHLSASGCMFERNGDWHDAAAARKHLQRKYDYLLDKGKIATAEDFIRGAATASSMSGRAYRVRCGETTVPSAQWFGAELSRIRER